ncbi:hypothetical protein V5799_029114 [Amblyomma americanum]|uniref:Ribonuclease H2 subunit B wHTH domain-containing protein n=1 Tax=Amblyomma americanum TaxID=6943 RepID=A0AAQ4ES81_AMBAM
MARQLKNEAVSSEDDSEPSRLFLLPSHCATGSERRHYIFPLPRPNTEEHSMFMATDSGDLMELAKYQMEHESFTADGPFETDQPVYMATPVDALFFALAPLYKHNDRFWPLKDIVEDCLLLKVIRSCSDRMQHIADVEGLGKDQVYRYNESKCLAWLTKKVKAVAARLQSIGIPPPAACSSAASAGSSGGSQPTSEDCMVAAHAIVARYIPPMLATVLKSSLGLDTRPATTVEEEKQKTPSLPQLKKKKFKQVQQQESNNKGAPKNSVQKSAKKKKSKQVQQQENNNEGAPENSVQKSAKKKKSKQVQQQESNNKGAPENSVQKSAKKKKSKQVQQQESNNKGAPENSVQKSAKTPRTAVRQKREKAAKAGMKSISSYFVKK